VEGDGRKVKEENKEAKVEKYEMEEGRGGGEKGLDCGGGGRCKT